MDECGTSDSSCSSGISSIERFCTYSAGGFRLMDGSKNH
jgi:hypothetical protein